MAHTSGMRWAEWAWSHGPAHGPCHLGCSPRNRCRVAHLGRPMGWAHRLHRRGLGAAMKPNERERSVRQIGDQKIKRRPCRVRHGTRVAGVCCVRRVSWVRAARVEVHTRAYVTPAPDCPWVTRVTTCCRCTVFTLLADVNTDAKNPTLRYMGPAMRVDVGEKMALAIGKFDVRAHRRTENHKRQVAMSARVTIISRFSHRSAPRSGSLKPSLL